MGKMKDSGIDWIGDIPESWKIVRNKNLFNCTKIIVGEDWKKNQLLSLTTKGVVKKEFNNLLGKLPESFSTYQRVNKNNMIMCLFDLDCSAVFSGISRYDGIISPAYKILNCKKNIFPLYADFWFRFIFQGRKFKIYSKNLRYTLSYDEFSVLPIIIPNFDEQQRIADFLDKKCGEIDNIITRTKATIEEYKKLKQSVITQAVTKGIRKNRPMKDSGIDWIGDIPQEWNISKVKYISAFQPICDTSYLNNESVITYTPMEYIKNGYYIENNAIFGNLSSSLTPYMNGDIVIAKVTPCFENGNIAIMDNLSSNFGLGSSELFVLRPQNINTKFLFYWLQNKKFIDVACSTMTGTGGLKRVSPYFMKNSPICITDIAEQQEIVSYLDEKCSEIDKLIQKKEQLLDELENYKKSLIYEYVTGKREVK